MMQEQKQQKKYIWQQTLPLLVWLIPFLLFSNTFSFGLVWDDLFFLEKNPFLLNKNPWSAFALDFWEGSNTPFLSGFYRPFILLSYWVQHALFKPSPFGYHWVSVFLHSFNSLLLFWLAKNLLQCSKKSFWIAILFAVHPVNAGTVSNIASQTDLWATFFVLLGLLTGLRKDTFFWLTIPFFFTGLLCKEIAVVGPIGLFFIRRWEEKPKKINDWIPLVAPFLSYLLYATTRLGTVGFSRVSGKELEEVPFVGGTLFLKYLGRIFFPTQQFPFEKVQPASLGIGIATICVLGLVFLVCLWCSRESISATFLLFFMVTMLPTSEIFRLGTRFSDSLLYLPLLLFLLFFLAKIPMKPWVVGSLVVITLFFSVKTRTYSSFWKDEKTLWSTASRFNPTNHNLLLNWGFYDLKRNKIEQAKKHFEKALSLKPNFGRAHRGMTEYYLKKRDFKKAFFHSKKYYQLQTREAKQYALTANLYAISLLQTKQITKAIEVLWEVIPLDPKRVSLVQNLGVAYFRNKQFKLAFQQFRKVNQMQPLHKKALRFQALSLIALKNWDLAEWTAHFFQKIFPKDPYSTELLAIIFIQQEKWEQAIQTYTKGFQKFQLPFFQERIKQIKEIRQKKGKHK